MVRLNISSLTDAVDVNCPSYINFSYISSLATKISVPSKIFPIAVNSSLEYTVPVGLEGDVKTSIFVLFVIASFSCWGVILKFVVSVVVTSITLPPQYLTISGYVTQYGAGIITSSSSSITTEKRLNKDCLAPLLTITPAILYVRLLSFLSLSIIACFNSGIPSTAVYFVKPSFMAVIAASLMGLGVSKSGSPAEKLSISLPSALRSAARFDTAIVIDVESALMRFVSINYTLCFFQIIPKKYSIFYVARYWD